MDNSGHRPSDGSVDHNLQPPPFSYASSVDRPTSDKVPWARRPQPNGVASPVLRIESHKPHSHWAPLVREPRHSIMASVHRDINLGSNGATRPDKRDEPPAITSGVAPTLAQQAFPFTVVNLGTPVQAAAASPSPPVTPTFADPQAKSRGRPRGWRPGMTYREVRGLPAAATSGPRPAKPKPGAAGIHDAKRKGRLPRQTSTSLMRAIYDRITPSFPVFYCEWGGCKAELHNVETLNRHVRIVHAERQAPSPSPRICKWGPCAQQQQHPQTQQQQAQASTLEAEKSPETFTTLDDLMLHIRREHLDPVIWHMGDGPRNTIGGTAEVDLPGYLFDANGNQVVPSIKGQRIEDEAARKMRRMKVKALLARIDMEAPLDSIYQDNGGTEDEVMTLYA